MDKKQFVLSVIEKVNSKKHCSKEEIETALSYLRELVSNGSHIGTKAYSMQISGLLVAALDKVSK